MLAVGLTLNPVTRQQGKYSVGHTFNIYMAILLGFFHDIKVKKNLQNLFCGNKCEKAEKKQEHTSSFPSFLW